MNDKNKTNSRPLTESEMDQLLTRFYRSEVPQALDNLPSSWPQLNAPQSEQPKSTELEIAPAIPAVETIPSVNRGIAVAVATLAACLVLIVFSDIGPSLEPSGTAGTVVKPTEPDDQLMNVSGDGSGNGAALDENQTSLEEIDQIELGPVNHRPAQKAPVEGQ